MATKRNERGRLIFDCPNCGAGACIVHTAVNCADGRWTVIMVLNAEGFIVYSNPFVDDMDDLRAHCTSCGIECVNEFQEVEAQEEMPELY